MRFIVFRLHSGVWMERPEIEREIADCPEYLEYSVYSRKSTRVCLSVSLIAGGDRATKVCSLTIMIIVCVDRPKVTSHFLQSVLGIFHRASPHPHHPHHHSQS
jgi:hypothetical protein